MSSRPSFLQFLPVSLFGGVMGLSGLCFAWRIAHEVWQTPIVISEMLGLIAIIAFIALTITYGVKCTRYMSLIKTEFNHPTSICFFATFIISLLLLPGILLNYAAKLALGMWAIGAVLMFGFAWFVLKKWMDNQQDPGSAVPAWVLPVVGTLDVPIIGNRFSFPGSREICLLFFGIGLLFVVILLVVIISRLMFQPPLPEPVQPTLLILTGPFALAFNSYIGLSGTLDITAAVFLYFNLFLLLLLASKIILIPKSCPFRVSWWSVSFPLAATTIATLNYTKHTMAIGHQLVAGLLLAVTSFVIGYLLILTITKIVKGTFVPAS
jgi:tellurite resistance protein